MQALRENGKPNGKWTPRDRLSNIALHKRCLCDSPADVLDRPSRENSGIFTASAAFPFPRGRCLKRLPHGTDEARASTWMLGRLYHVKLWFVKIRNCKNIKKFVSLFVLQCQMFCLISASRAAGHHKVKPEPFGSDLTFLPLLAQQIFRCLRPAPPAFFVLWVKSGAKTFEISVRVC